MSEIPRAAIALHMFASTDIDRNNIEVVRFEHEDGENIAVATNGHLAGVVRWRAAWPFGEKKSVHFSGKALAQLWRGGAARTARAMNGGLRFGDITLGEPITEGDFPEWRKILPEEIPEQEVEAVGMSHMYLKLIGEFAEAAKLYPVNSMEARGELDTVVFRFEGEADEKVMVVLMPARLDRGDLR